MKTKMMMALLASAAGACYSAPAMAQAQDMYIGQMMLVPYTYCPRGWVNASGQIMSIAQNTTLFALLGTTYGGDGVRTFGLPNLQSRTVIGAGQSAGLNNYSIGQLGGNETITMTNAQLPIHSHLATGASVIRVAAGKVADTNKPGGNAFAQTGATNVYYTGAPTNNYMDNANVETTVTVGTAGGSQPFSIVQPYLTLQWCIALTGIYPSRN